MVSPKLVIRNSNNRIQFIAPAISMQLIAKGTAMTRTDIRVGNTGPSCITIPAPPSSSNTQLIALRAPFYVAVGGTREMNGQNYAVFSCDQYAANQAVDYWIFDYASKIGEGGGPGLRLRDPTTGELIYNSNYDNMRIAATPYLGNSIDQSYAEVSLPADRTYATILPSMSGYNQSTMTLYRDGQATIEGGDGGLEGGDDYAHWQRLNDGKLWGTRWNNNVLQAGPVSFDDVIIEAPGFAYQPDPPTIWWDNPLQTVMIVDVTGL